MLMGFIQANQFNLMLKKGGVDESKGDKCFHDKDYSTAVTWYVKAKKEYRKAFNLAKENNDNSAKRKASSMERECEIKRQDAFCANYGINVSII